MENREDAKVEVKSRKRRPDEGDLDITPMIDITFLLLAFFVVVSRMDPSTAVPMPLAKHGDTVAEQESVIVVVLESEGDVPLVYRGKSKKDAAKCSDDIETMEDELASYIEEELANDVLKRAVIIKAERRVKFRHLDIVKRAVSRSLNEDEHTIHLGVEEQ